MYNVKIRGGFLVSMLHRAGSLTSLSKVCIKDFSCLKVQYSMFNERFKKKNPEKVEIAN